MLLSWDVAFVPPIARAPLLTEEQRCAAKTATARPSSPLGAFTRQPTVQGPCARSFVVPARIPADIGMAWSHPTEATVAAGASLPTKAAIRPVPRAMVRLGVVESTGSA